jgi:hypothetical protein
MKKLNFLTLTAIFTLVATVTMANPFKEEITTNVESISDLRASIKHMVKYDFNRTGNFFYNNGINKMKADVVVDFYISKDKKVILLSVKCRNCMAEDYVKQLLNQQEINVADNLTQKRYRIELKLDYRT